jgi:hypothetical protein
MSIGIVDTTIFCEFLNVPHKSQCHDAIVNQLHDYINQGVTLLLPMATIIETGNHIAQNGDGNLRRKTAITFVREVQKAIDGEAGWTISRPLLDLDVLRDYLNEFPNYALQGTGLGDLSIIKEFTYQCKLHPQRHIFIWSLDRHLRSYIQDGDM